MKVEEHKPSQNDVSNFDISCECKEWNMYSYDRPAYMLWNAAGRALFANGWTKDEIRVLLQSKHPRWALDGSLGDAIRSAAKQWAKDIELAKADVQKWIKEDY